MQRWRVRPSAQPLPQPAVCGIVAGIGTPRLAAHYLESLQAALPLTFCTVFAVGSSGRLEIVSAASSYGQTAEHTAAHYIEQRFDRVDPHMAWLAARKRPARIQVWLGHHRGDELADGAYRAACYTDVGIRERASVLMLLPSGQRAAVSFYRSLAQPEFGAPDFALLAGHAGVLAQATAAHGRIAQAIGAAIEPELSSRMLALSRREREVVSCLREGRSAKETALALGVELSTVRTHQYRAFRRLGIRTLKELLRSGPL